MNILLEGPLPTAGVTMPGDLRRAIREGVNFKIADDELVRKAMESPPGSYERDIWLPTIKESTYRLIIHGLVVQLMWAKMPWYKRIFNRFKGIFNKK
jgi:hypothetical protein